MTIGRRQRSPHRVDVAVEQRINIALRYVTCIIAQPRRGIRPRQFLEHASDLAIQAMTDARTLATRWLVRSWKLHASKMCVTRSRMSCVRPHSKLPFSRPIKLVAA